METTVLKSPPYRLSELVGYALKLGTVGFGGPVALVAFVDGVTAAAVGAIAGASVVLGRRTIFEDGGIPELPKVVILLLTVAAITKFSKLPEPVIVLLAAIVGMLVFPILHG